MKNLTSPTTINELKEKYNFNLRKRFGQNFLVDQNIVEKIADSSDIQDDDFVVEIGPGIGTLTRELAKKAKELTVVEIDRDLIPVLEDTLSDFDNINIINDDFLKVDLNELNPEGKPLKISANLPYYITTPIIMSLLESDIDIESMSFLVQKEVADRIAAEPGNKSYGSLSVIAQYYADIHKAFDVPASVFMPRPKVDSAVVVLKKKKDLNENVSKDKYFKVVKGAFLNRRKTLLNSLSSNLGFSKDRIREMLQKLDIDEKIRPEKLTDKDFERITNELYPSS